MGRATDGHWGPRHNFASTASSAGYHASVAWYANHVLAGWTHQVGSDAYSARVVDRVNGTWTADRAVTAASRVFAGMSAGAGKVTAFLAVDLWSAATHVEAPTAALS